MNRSVKLHKRIIGMPCVITRRAADLRGFHFGKIIKTKEDSGTFYRGELILHVTTFWRIMQGSTVFVSSNDLWLPTEGNPWNENWDYAEGNLQDEKIAVLFPRHRKKDKSDYADNLYVTNSVLKKNNDLFIYFNNQYVLEIYNNGEDGNVRFIDWQSKKHYVLLNDR